MARIRTIKPEFCKSKSVARLSRDARLFYALLWMEADDRGRLEWMPKQLAGSLYPHDEDVTGRDIQAWADECAAEGMLDFYEADGDRFCWIVKFLDHQVINRPTASKLPASPKESQQTTETFTEDSLNTHGGLTEDSCDTPCAEIGSRNREIGNGEGESKQEVIPTSPASATPQSAKRLERFDEIWIAFEREYPKRRGDLDKKKARDKLKALILGGKSPGSILAGVKSYRLFCDREDKTGTPLVAMMTTWLNGERWNEDYSPPKEKSRPGFASGNDPRVLR